MKNVLITNGDVVKQMFPDIEVYTGKFGEGIIFVTVNHHGTYISEDWWNAPYKIKEKVCNIEKILDLMKSNKEYGYADAPLITDYHGNPWRYDKRNNEEALLNNIKNCEVERVGKVYYIQAYYHDSIDKYFEKGSRITNNIPYVVIGKNHDMTNNTLDLMSLVPAIYMKWNINTNNWENCKYSKSKIYDWLKYVCPDGYSKDIQENMYEMLECWREATGDSTGTLYTRETKCKLLNPIELFGDSIKEYKTEYELLSDFKEDLDSRYGEKYPLFDNFAVNRSNRRIYQNKDSSSIDSGLRVNAWTNSYLGLGYYFTNGFNNSCFVLYRDGSCNYSVPDSILAVAPVIRLGY